jgi:hypothetical protein
MRNFKRPLSTTSCVFFSVALAFLVSGCFENNIGSSFKGTTTTLSSNNTSLSGFTISTVQITAPSTTTSSASALLTTIFFNSSASNSITNFCASTTSSQACVCNFSWQQQLSTDGSVDPLPRVVQSSLITVQPNLVTCNAPEVYNNEIPTGTVIAISVVPGTGNASSFGMTPFNFTKSSSNSGGGSFSDSQGNTFQNIDRYSCYEEYQRGMSIGNQKVPYTNPTTGATTTVVSASQLCVQTEGSSTVSSTCTGQLANPDFTAQANYYNLYIRDSEKGDINLGNSIYKCPQIKESLHNNGTVGTQGLPWPLDSTFALALSSSASFNVGVQAFSKVSDGSDPVSANSGSCFTTAASPSPGVSTTGTTSTTTSGTDSNSLVSSCLGFAMTPNADGSCPYFKNAGNQVVFTYRLRRYVALYPKVFDTNGLPSTNEPVQAVDTLYVVDRPVTSPNPLQPYTMKGPKPCPFAYFDKKGVTDTVADAAYNYYNGGVNTNACLSQADSSNGSRPGYVGTSNTSWTGTNFDGIQFPNVDTVNSCSAVIPVLDQYRQYMSIATVNAANPQYTHQYIRPVSAWAPHYEEDTSFQACAPLSNSFQDPPLHFAKDSTGNVSWCAEAYPTQNQNINALDKLSVAPSGTFPASCPALVNEYVGRVENFTSPVVKNSASSACVATIPTPIPSNYPVSSSAACPASGGSSNPQGMARHPSDLVADTVTTYPGNNPGATPATSNVCAPQTCDRTVMNTGSDWQRFPLQARPAQIEAAITNDNSYNCTVTYDASGPKTGKLTPSGGCCGPVVYVKTGLGGNTTAHLEPDVSCVTPAY